jgi:hypothetical protein
VTGHVYVPDQLPCGNGCHTGHGPTRTPVLCEGAARICVKCVERLDTWLRQIPDTYILLPYVVEHGTVSTNPEMATTKRPDAPAPLRLEVLDLLDRRLHRGVLGLVKSWADLVRSLRRLPPRAGLDATVTSECQLLLGHLTWVTEQIWITDLYAELRPLVRELLDRVGEYRAKPVGMCVALVDRPGLTVQVLCGGPLYLDKDRRGTHCAACGDRHDAGELRRLGRTVGLIGDDGEQEAS